MLKSVIVIERHVVDSWVGAPPTFLAVALDEASAKQWIQDEVDGNHNNGYLYAAGRDADWWIQYGIFSLRVVPIEGA